MHVTGKDSSNNAENIKTEINKEVLETLEGFKYLGAVKKDDRCIKHLKARTGIWRRTK